MWPKQTEEQKTVALSWNKEKRNKVRKDKRDKGPPAKTPKITLAQKGLHNDILHKKDYT